MSERRIPAVVKRRRHLIRLISTAANEAALDHYMALFARMIPYDPSHEKLYTNKGVLHDPADDMPRDCLIEWLRFEVECENFDRALPGFWLEWGKDEWMPFDRSSSAEFARQAKEACESKLRSSGYHSDAWRTARRYVASLTYDRQREMLYHLLGKELPPKPVPPNAGFLGRR